MSQELLKVKPSKVIDVCGESCPVPEMSAAKVLKKMNSGEVLEVVTDHQPAYEVTLPSLAKNLGYPFASLQDGDVVRFRIMKK